MNERDESLALINGDVYPFAAPGRCSAVFVRGGRIERLGADADVLALCGRHTEVLDLRGCTVLPGFIAAVDLSAEERARPDFVRRLCESGLTFVRGDAAVGGDEFAPSQRWGRGEAEIAFAPGLVARSAEEAAEALRILSDMPHGLGTLRLVLDGAIRDRTAALAADYADSPGIFGNPRFSRDAVLAVAFEARKAGIALVFQAEGDAAVELALAAAEAAGPAARWGIAGCGMPSAGQFARIARAALHVEAEPHRPGRDWPAILPRLGTERARLAFAWRTMLRHRIELATASLSPAQPFAPLAGVAALISRRGDDGEPALGWMPSERLDRPEAFWAYTGGAARAFGRFDERGTLEPGKAADMVVLMRNPFAVPAEEVAEVPVGMTIAGGRVVYIR